MGYLPNFNKMSSEDIYQKDDNKDDCLNWKCLNLCHYHWFQILVVWYKDNIVIIYDNYYIVISNLLINWYRESIFINNSIKSFIGISSIMVIKIGSTIPSSILFSMYMNHI
jgi:hypothetical protein